MFMLEKRKNYQRPQQSFNEKLRQLVRSQETQKRKAMHSLNLSRT